MDIPLFSLGLTKEAVLNVTPLSDINVADNIDDPQSSRKSKREVERKFVCLSDKLTGNVVINVSGLSVSSKEMLLLAERSRVLSAKMLPYLARHLCEDMRQDGVMPYQFDRPKVISQNDNPPDSGLMAALMVTHAVYGIEACKNITYDSLGKEGESAAIMAYKFNEVL
ncbi:hypothetical protein Bca52824_001205 [Brassica carinata]|uniref:Uncharacterized protein n=1 Tax=Brassica carinata TaxID=52824 RepID=A0A8X8BCH4_BRACI|nr:hypothetical protein Bca52824_001205 [Brassica carinata]